MISVTLATKGTVFIDLFVQQNLLASDQHAQASRILRFSGVVQGYSARMRRTHKVYCRYQVGR